MSDRQYSRGSPPVAPEAADIRDQPPNVFMDVRDDRAFPVVEEPNTPGARCRSRRPLLAGGQFVLAKGVAG